MTAPTTTAAYVMDSMTSNTTSSDHGAPTQGQKIAVVCILSVLSVFGTVGNALVLYVFSSKGNKVTSTIFILALAWADVFTCSVIIPFTIAFITTEQNLGHDSLCKLYHFLITFNVPLAAFIMVAIAVDRYFSICHPFLHAVTPRRARLTVFVLCIFAFLMGTITAIAYGLVDVNAAYFSAAGLGDGGDSNNNSSGGGGAGGGGVAGGLMLPSSLPGNSSSLPAGNSSLPVGNPSSLPAGNTSSLPAGNSSSLPETVVSLWSVTSPTPTGSVEGGYICHPTGRIISIEILLKYQKFYASFYLLSLVAVLVIYAVIYRSVVRRREWRRRQRSSRPIIKSPVTIATDVEEFELRTKTDAEALNHDHHNSNNNGEEEDEDDDDDDDDHHHHHLSGNEDGNPTGNDTNAVKGEGNERKSSSKKLRNETSPLSGETRCLNSTASQKKASKERRDFNFLANIRTAGMLFVVSIVFIVSFLPAWLMAVQVVSYHIVVFYLYFVYNVANPVIYAFMNHAFRKELKRMLHRGLNFCHD